MAEFEEVMRQWKRMCDAMEKEFHDGSCEHCKANDITEKNCGGIWDVSPETDWAALAKAVMDWAEENPEPKYPTWGEWFEEQGELTAEWRDIRVVSNVGTGVIGVLYQHIPADIAEKLGIEPKEG